MNIQGNLHRGKYILIDILVFSLSPLIYCNFSAKVFFFFFYVSWASTLKTSWSEISSHRLTNAKNLFLCPSPLPPKITRSHHVLPDYNLKAPSETVTETRLPCYSSQIQQICKYKKVPSLSPIKTHDIAHARQAAQNAKSPPFKQPCEVRLLSMH